MSIHAITLLVVFVPVCLIVAIGCIRKKKPFWQTFIALIFVAYIGAALALTLFPLPLYLLEGQTYYDMGYNLIPFHEMSNIISSRAGDPIWWWVPFYLIGGNFCLLLPLGLMAPYLFKRLRPTKTAVLFLLGASFPIEIMQLLIGLHAGYLYRSVDIDDVILNFSGALVGYLLYRVGRSALAKHREKKELLGTLNSGQPKPDNENL